MPLSSRPHKNVRMHLVAVLLISALSVSVSLARGGHTQPSGSAKSWVSPDPVANGSQFFVYGSGFQPGQSLAILVSDGVSGSYLLTTANSTGSFSVWSWAQFLVSGTKNVAVYQSGDRHMTVLSSCTFQVL